MFLWHWVDDTDKKIAIWQGNEIWNEIEKVSAGCRMKLWISSSISSRMLRVDNLHAILIKNKSDAHFCLKVPHHAK